MAKKRFNYLMLFFACSLAGIFPNLNLFYFSRPPPLAPPFMSFGPDRNTLFAEKFVQEIHEFIKLASTGWDGCMKYKCNDEENCITPITASTSTSLPCCEDLLHRMAVDIDRLLLTFNATFFPFSGTLLGIIREGSVLPNNASADIDFLVDSTSYENIFVKPIGTLMRYAFYAEGYHTFSEGNLGRICFRKFSPLGLEEDLQAANFTHGDHWKYFNNYKYGDFYKTEQRNDSKIYILIKGNHFPKGIQFDDVYPLRSVKIKDHEFRVPLRSEEMLTALYGNWTIAKQSKHHIQEMKRGGDSVL